MFRVRFTELYLHRAHLLLCYLCFWSESRAGTASVSLGIIPNVLHLGWFAHDSQRLCRSLILLHLSKPWRIIKRVRFFIYFSMFCILKGSFWKSFQWELSLQSASQGDLSSSAVSCFTPRPQELSQHHTKEMSLSSFLHVCVSVCVPAWMCACTRLRSPDETFMQSLYASQTLHFPNELLPCRRPQCVGWRHGNRLLTAYLGPTPRQGVV